MIDIFNKNKVKALEKQISYYERLLEAKNKTITQLHSNISSNNKTIDKLLSDNGKLIDWIEKILDEVGVKTTCGYNENIRIPYTVNIRELSPNDYKSINDMINIKCIQVPAITFIRRSC